MVNTSLGYHTLSVFQKLSGEEYFSLDNKFIGYMRESGRMKMQPIKNKKGRMIGREYTYKNSTGIRWLVLDMEAGNGFKIYGVKAIINPKVLLEKNYIAIANEIDIPKLKTAFSSEANKISLLLGNLNLYSMCRGDYCLNADLKELDIPCSSGQMMMLIKRGDIPAHFVERTKYDTISRRQKPDKNSFYLESGSVVVNCYDKYAQLLHEMRHPCANKDDADSIVRFEVQCKYLKLYAMSKSQVKVSNTPIPSMPVYSSASELYDLYEDILSNRRNAIPVDTLLSNAVSVEIVQKYFQKIVRAGDYYALERAKYVIQSSSYHPKKKDRLIDALVLTNRCRGIYKVKNTLKGKELAEYKRSLKDLDHLGVNPVTIPREWGIAHIPNLLNAYYDKRSEEQEAEFQQKASRKILEDYYNRRRKRKNS